MKILVIGKEGRLKKYMPKTINADDYEITYVSMSAEDDEIIEKGQGAEIMLVDAMARVSAKVIDSLPELKMIHSEGVGYNYFDINHAKEKGVYVCNCKAANAMTVAEQSILLMMALLRHLPEGDVAFREGRQIQTKEAHMLSGDLRELSECTVGLLGFGGITGGAFRRCHGMFWSNVLKIREGLRPERIVNEEGRL